MSIDIKNATEQMLTGMSNMLTDNDWKSMLLDRLVAKDDGQDRTLSKEFIIRHKNLLNLEHFSLYVMKAWETKQLNMDFLHQFWKFVNFPDGDKIFKNFCKSAGLEKSNFLEEYTAQVDPTETALIFFEDVKPFTMEQLDKRPFHYNSEQWAGSMARMSEVPTLDFIEKYIHLVDFCALLTNRHFTDAQKTAIYDKFGIKDTAAGENSQTVMLPDGTYFNVDNPRTVIPGGKYLRNKKRFTDCPIATDENIAKMVQMFPRAFEDCLFPENAEVMKDK